MRASMRRPISWPRPKFPVIVAGGGVIFSDGVKEAWRSPNSSQAPVVNSYLHNDCFPADHPLWCGPLGYQGSKAAMKLIAKADVVLALGTRLGPFGTLAAAWARLLAEECQDHPGRHRSPHARPGQADLGRHRRRCQGGGEGAVLSARQSQACLRPPMPSERQKRIKAEKDAWEKELDDWTHEKDAWSLEDRQGLALHASAPDAARA